MTDWLPVGASRCAFLTAKERDSESNLDYFGARYFSGAQGRFTSVDPENASAIPEDPQSWNAYAYARNNPLLYTDPTGERFRICDTNGNCEENYSDKDFAENFVIPRNIDWDGRNIYQIGKDGEKSLIGTAEFLGRDEPYANPEPALESAGLGPFELAIPGNVFRKELRVGAEAAEQGLRSFFKPGIFGSEAGFAAIGGSVRETAARIGAQLVKKFKQEGIGTQVGRSGGHGAAFKRAGAELIRMANQTADKELREALKVEGKRLIEKGSSISHK
ncbi:MAG: RHS repeat-associated core domain-containing protein [Acidobacteriota bacterium]